MVVVRSASRSSLLFEHDPSGQIASEGDALRKTGIPPHRVKALEVKLFRIML